MKNLFIALTFILGLNSYSQYGYKPKHENNNLKGWDKLNENSVDNFSVLGIEVLKDSFLNKTITPVRVARKQREFSYKNFFVDKSLTEKLRDKNYKGLMSQTKNTLGRSLIVYKPNNNYRLLYGKKFIVVKIEPISKDKHLSNTDDSNFIFVLYNEDFGEIYYKYNNKFKDNVEIELF